MTALIGWPAQLPYPVLFLFPWSSWRQCQVGCPLTLQVISYCHNREGTHPSPTFPMDPKSSDQALFLLPGNPGHPI